MKQPLLSRQIVKKISRWFGNERGGKWIRAVSSLMRTSTCTKFRWITESFKFLVFLVWNHWKMLCFIMRLRFSTCCNKSNVWHFFVFSWVDKYLQNWTWKCEGGYGSVAWLGWRCVKTWDNVAALALCQEPMWRGKITFVWKHVGTYSNVPWCWRGSVMVRQRGTGWKRTKTYKNHRRGNVKTYCKVTWCVYVWLCIPYVKNPPHFTCIPFHLTHLATNSWEKISIKTKVWNMCTATRSGFWPGMCVLEKYSSVVVRIEFYRMRVPCVQRRGFEISGPQRQQFSLGKKCT